MGEIFLRFQGLSLAEWLQVFTVSLLLVMLLILLRRRPTVDLSAILLHFEAIERGQERTEKSLREELARNREESSANSRQSREELTATLNAFAGSLQSRMAEIAGLQKDQLDSFAKQLVLLTQANEQRLERMRETIEQQLRTIQQ